MAGSFNQPFTFKNVQCCQCNSTACWVSGVGECMHPAALRRDFRHDLVDPIGDADSPQRQVPRRNSLGKRHDVRLDIPMFQAKPLSSPSESGDDFIRNQEHVVLVANLANPWKIVGLRNNQAACALHGFGNEGGDGICAFAKNCFL